MNTWAVLAAKEAAVASGLGAGIVPAVGAGSLDGFALGALMSGTCILMLTSPRRGRRRGLAAAASGRALAAARERHQPAMPEPAGPEPAVPDAVLPRAAGPEAVPGAVLPHAAGPEAARDVTAGYRAPITVPAPQPDENGAEAEDREEVAGGGGYRSRHRLADQGVSSRRSGTRRNSPRHAAPPASFSSRMTGRIAGRALAGGARS